MNNIRYDRGELKKRSHPSDLLQAMVFDIPTRSDVRDIEVITLKQHLRDKASLTAWNMKSGSVIEIERKIEELLHTEFTRAREFVEVTESNIIVGINADFVDDDTVERALNLLCQVSDITVPQTVEFGEVEEIYETEN